MNKNPDKAATAVIVSSLKKESSRLIKKIDGFRIKDAESYEQLVSYVKVLRELEKRADEKRKSITNHLNALAKEINGLFNPFFNDIEISIDNAKEEMLKFEQKKIESEKQLEESFSKGKISVGKFAAKQAELSAKVKGVSVRKNVILKILDEAKIPRAYLVPNEMQILADLKAGKKIPGCTIDEKPSIAI